MLNRRALRGWRQMLVNQGLFATLRTGAERITQRFRRSKHDDSTEPMTAIAEDKAQVLAHPFDREFNVDTSGLIWGEHLETGSANDQWNTAYYGIAPSVFRSLLDRIYASTVDAAFVDMGSGKGRGVLLATQYPFAEVHGVELSPVLHAIAKANVDRTQQEGFVRTNVHLHQMDAADFEFPARPLVLFFYHPFCKPVLKRVLKNLHRSLQAQPRATHIVYVNTELREVLDAASFLTRVLTETLMMSAEDQLADRVGSTREDCAIYTIRNQPH